ncbi:MAG: glutamyl-tRNA reductase [Planctomycetota bacterium]|nr:glutamyl-tRNA reductase [Planctomycetota bacterium]
MRISIIGIDFHTAAVELRQRAALDRSQTMKLLRAIRDDGICEEALALCTCNRTEIYFVWPLGGGSEPDRVLAHISEIKGQPPLGPSGFYRMDELEAVEHLFRVAVSLEAQVVGEHEVIGQVKNAYKLACEARTAGFLLHKLLHWSFRLAKRIRNETNLCRGTASVSQAAVDLAAEVLGSLAGASALLVGAGTAGRLAAEALVRSGAENLIVANRTIDGAHKIAGSFAAAPAARAVGLSEIPSVINEVDVVISSTGSPAPVLKCGELGGVLQNRRRPLVVIDISVPRDVEPELAEIPGVQLYDIDGLDGVIAAGLEQRRSEIPSAEAIVKAEVRRFGKWFSSLQAVPTIKLLQRYVSACRQAELKRHAGKFDPAERAQLEQFARSLSRKIIHGPINFLRTLSDDGHGSSDLAAVELLREIFDLDAAEGDE